MPPRSLSRRDFLSAIGGASAAAATGALWAAEPPRQPNIVLIVADDLGYDDLGSESATDLRTPHIDALAAGGVRFSDGYVNCPVCSPSRAGLITGRYPQEFGYEVNPPSDLSAIPANFGLPLRQRTIANHLQKLGYATGLIGKWHLGAGEKFRPLHRGYDEFFGFLHGSRSYYQEGANPSNPLWDNDRRVEEREYLTDAFARKAVSFVERHRNQPFFLHLAFNAVHSPMQAPPRNYLERFGHINNLVRKRFAAMLAAMDDGVGRVLQGIRRRRLEDDTLVIFISDNGGTARAGHPLKKTVQGGKGSLHEGGIRVPFIMRWPGNITAGSVYRQPVSAMDILPTILAAVGALPYKPADGVNLLPHLQQTLSDAPHEVLYWKYTNQSAVRKGNWKLLSRFPDEPPMLFDLSVDQMEQYDLAAAQPVRASELADLLNIWKARLPKPLWDFAPAHTAEGDEAVTSEDPSNE
ncbi:MAG TPA: sulfatase-like hydrolase/transferase [Tepidisphaeraceae bacterium]|nr:sulfatase-like hydrolase/transferase [Tepidisphaeraceae bacterium]